MKPGRRGADLRGLEDRRQHVEVRQRLGSSSHQRFDGAVIHQHRVVEGSCRLKVHDGGETLDLDEGDFVLVTRGQAHSIEARDTASGLDGVSVVSGAFSRSGESADMLFGLLPPVLHVRASSLRAPPGWEGTVLALADHNASPVGREAMWARLAELLFLIGARQVLAELRAPELWARPAFLHPHVGRAIRALHLEPMRKWTVERLARSACMSRSTFAEAFTRLVGEPPLAYLTRLRMQRAVDLLRAGDGITEVAAQVGYASDGAFGKAFKRALGVSPGAYRAATAAARVRSTGLSAPPTVEDARALALEEASVQDKLARIAYDLEHLIPPARCAIMRFDRSDLTLRHGAAPSLPALYCRAIDGVKVGPCVGSCGTAVHRRAPVVVRDTSESPLWADYRYLAERFHLRSCWSKPIFGASGEVLGTFAIYYRDRHEPNDVELAIADHLAEQVRPIFAG
ncbi:MAG: helix-turn-helix domain-containing protein [Myxococcota bacterium]